MRQTLAIIKKNLLLLARSKISTFVVVGGPLILILLLGLGVANNYSNIRVGYVLEDEQFNPMIDVLSSQEGFLLNEIPQEGNCIESVKQGQQHVCIVFGSIDKNTSLYVDFSRANLAYTLLSTLSDQFAEQSDIMSTRMIRELLDNLLLASSTLQNESTALKSVTADVKRLPVQLNSIKEGIGKFDIDFSYQLDYENRIDSVREKLVSYEDELDTAYIQYRDELLVLRENVTENKESLEEKREERDEYLENIDEQWETNSCDEKRYTDLTPYIENGEDVDFSYYDPECSALYTSRLQIIENTGDLDNNIAMLEEMEHLIDEALVDIGRYHTKVETAFGDTDSELSSAEREYEDAEETIDTLKVQLRELRTLRTKILQDMQGFSTTINTSLVLLDDMETVLEDLSEDINTLSNVDPGQLANPTGVNIHLTHETEGSLNYFFPSLLVIIMSFTCMILSSLMTIRERKSRAFFRNSILPLKKSSFLGGILLTVVIIGVVQTLLVSLIGKHFFDVVGLENILVVGIIILMSCVLFAFIGILMGSLLNTQESVILGTLLTVIILFTFSGMLIPLELMSETVFNIIKINPFVLSEMFLKRAMVYKISLFGFDLVSYYLAELFILGSITTFLFSRKMKQA